MIDTAELKKILQKMIEQRDYMKNKIDYDQKIIELTQVKNELENDPEIWQDIEKSTQLGKKKSELENVVTEFENVNEKVNYQNELLELAIEDNDENLLKEIDQDIKLLEKELNKFETSLLFYKKEDVLNAYLTIQAGSGGTEAQDWAEILLRMYTKWCDLNDFRYQLIDDMKGEGAGIKYATLHVTGKLAYGWLRTETGVHRLVRKSPFDSNNKRHTSFASVFVSPEVDESIEITINPSDLRIDTYRASGAGGQHVNKTDSAVRITHLPTNTVAQCQNERSQHKNKANAMKQLQSKLYELELKKLQGEKQKVEESKSDISWGNQIRSYTLDQSRIKDLRTNVETSNCTAVLDGDINLFIEASLRA